jgi:Tol biopolymer transport system component
MNESIDRAAVDWLRAGPETGPEPGLEQALEATRRVRQRPGWVLPERWIPMQLTMSRTPSARPFLLLATVALLVAGLVVTALIAGSNRRLPEPFGLAGNGLVAFARDGDILVADGPTSDPRVLVGGTESDSRPAFSLQGDRLAFVREASDGLLLLVSAVDGSGARVIAGPLQTFEGGSWSPDGSQILVGFSEDGMSRLAIVMADGSGSRTLGVSGPADWASWRPDGRQLVFRGQPGDGTQAAAVYLAEADGSNVQRLALEGSSTSVGDFDRLAWSPDGAHLVYMREGDGMAWQTHVVDIDEAGNISADRAMRFVPDSTSEALPVWSPDGSRLAFVLERDGQGQVALADASGSGEVILVGPSAPIATTNFDQSWSPDGRTLLVVQFIGPSEALGEAILWAVDVETGAQQRVDSQPGDLLAWQRLAP